MNNPTVAGTINWPTFSSRVIEASVVSAHDFAAVFGSTLFFWLPLGGKDANTFEALNTSRTSKTLLMNNTDSPVSIIGGHSPPLNKKFCKKDIPLRV